MSSLDSTPHATTPTAPTRRGADTASVPDLPAPASAQAQAGAKAPSFATSERDAAELSAIGTNIRGQLPHLPQEDVLELARAVADLVHAFHPERIYVFGSQARGAPTANSDVDLLVLVTTSDQLPHRRAQAAYTAVGAHRVPLDILVMTQAEFDARLPAVASLPATVAREGRTIYAPAA